MKKAQELQEPKKPMAINKLYTDAEFDNPPYALTSSVVKCMEPDRRIRCVMVTMAYHAKGFADAYNTLYP